MENIILAWENVEYLIVWNKENRAENCPRDPETTLQITCVG